MTQGRPTFGTSYDTSGIRNVSRAIRDMARSQEVPLVICEDVLEREFEQVFQSGGKRKPEVARAGIPWQELAPKTIAKRIRDSKKKTLGFYGIQGILDPLVRSGRLKASLTSAAGVASDAIRIVTRHALTFATKRPWAMVHQKGAAVGPGKTSIVPPRPFVYITHGMIVGINRVFKLWIRTNIASATGRKKRGP